MHTTIIRNGLYFDGLGNSPQKKDVVIKNNIIDAVVDTAPTIDGAKEIDATGHWITPGFIDLHAHYDAEIEVMPSLDESLRHGVTTVIIGNCSLSAALGKDEDIVDLFARVENIPAKVLSDWIIGNVKWKNVREYYEHVDTLPLGCNVASFIGHSNIRIEAMGIERSFMEKNATKAEIDRMKGILNEAMQAGYLGMSVDMLPFHRWEGHFNPKYTGISVPSQRAAKSEYWKLSHVLRQYNRVLQITPNAVDKTSVATILKLSHGLYKKSLKTTIVAALDLKSNENIYKLLKLFSVLGNDVLRAKMLFQTLAEPFTVYGDGPITPLFEEFPSMIAAISASSEERKKLYKDEKFRAQFLKEWFHKADSVFPRALDQMIVVNSPDQSHIGKTFTQIAVEANKDAAEHFLDLFAEYDTAIRWKCDTSNHREKERMNLMSSKHCVPGFNDSGALHNVNMAFHDGGLQLLKQAMNNPEFMTIERAIQRITSEPSKFLGIDAGDISVGKRADLNIIDPTKLNSDVNSDVVEDYHPMFNGSYRLVKRSGKVVKHVFINGVEAYSNNGIVGFHEDLGKKKTFGQLLKSSWN